MYFIQYCVTIFTMAKEEFFPDPIHFTRFDYTKKKNLRAGTLFAMCRREANRIKKPVYVHHMIPAHFKTSPMFNMSVDIVIPTVDVECTLSKNNDVYGLHCDKLVWYTGEVIPARCIPDLSKNIEVVLVIYPKSISSFLRLEQWTLEINHQTVYTSIYKSDCHLLCEYIKV